MLAYQLSEHLEVLGTSYKRFLIGGMVVMPNREPFVLTRNVQNALPSNNKVHLRA
jgi:hypothetical protein